MKPMGRLANDSAWENAFCSRVQRMVRRDINHPCIIMWSLGNESGRGTNLAKARASIRELDNSRPICYEGGESERWNSSSSCRLVSHQWMNRKVGSWWKERGRPS